MHHNCSFYNFWYFSLFQLRLLKYKAYLCRSTRDDLVPLFFPFAANKKLHGILPSLQQYKSRHSSFITFENFVKIFVNKIFVKTQACNVSFVPKTSDHSNHDKEGDQPLPEEKIFKDDELVNMIDPILATDDKNHDGFIDYPEFVMAQQAATARS